MATKTIQAVIAAENPQVQHFLSEAIEQEAGAVVVGQAQNAGNAMTLVRKLRPDIALIDSFLPYTMGLDGNPQSRISGLDTAQIISEAAPDTRVILVSNLDTEMLLNHRPEVLSTVVYSVQSMRNDVPFGLNELCCEVSHSRGLVFASVEPKPGITSHQEAMKISDKLILAGAIGIVAGISLFITLMLAPVGIPLAFAGAMLVIFGWGWKLVTQWWRKIKSKTKYAVTNVT